MKTISYGDKKKAAVLFFAFENNTTAPLLKMYLQNPAEFADYINNFYTIMILNAFARFDKIERRECKKNNIDIKSSKYHRAVFWQEFWQLIYSHNTHSKSLKKINPGFLRNLSKDTFDTFCTLTTWKVENMHTINYQFYTTRELIFNILYTSFLSVCIPISLFNSMKLFHYVLCTSNNVLNTPLRHPLMYFFKNYTTILIHDMGMKQANVLFALIYMSMFGLFNYLFWTKILFTENATLPTCKDIAFDKFCIVRYIQTVIFNSTVFIAIQISNLPTLIAHLNGTYNYDRLGLIIEDFYSYISQKHPRRKLYYEDRENELMNQKLAEESVTLVPIIKDDDNKEVPNKPKQPVQTTPGIFLMSRKILCRLHSNLTQYFNQKKDLEESPEIDEEGYQAFH